jgi:hypothetical protein
MQENVRIEKNVTVNRQYSNSSETSDIDPRISPRHTRPGSICATMILRTIALSEVGPQPGQKKSAQLKS